ncbi:putative holin-like toxin [Alkalihalobacillus deserti]|nr:putative holin-like toxin [Alkalihalobacillus deserti]
MVTYEAMNTLFQFGTLIVTMFTALVTNKKK